MRRYAVFVSFLLLFSCGRKPVILMGTSREVLLVYSEDSKFSAGALYRYFSKVVHTPQPETLIIPRPIKWEKFPKFVGYRNKVLFLLPNDSLWELCKEERGIHFRKSTFVRGDFTVLICSYDSRDMLYMVSENLPVLWNTFLSKAVSELSEVEFLGGKDKGLSQEVRSRFGISLTIPAGWTKYKEGKDFLSFIKGHPNRFVFIYSEPGERFLHLDEILNLRDSLTSVYYQGDRVNRDFVSSFTDDLDGMSVFKVYGLWKNDSLMAGGPFVLYAFNRDGRFYMLDAGVFAPENENKVNLILRMEGILRTLK